MKYVIAGSEATEAISERRLLRRPKGLLAMTTLFNLSRRGQRASGCASKANAKVVF